MRGYGWRLGCLIPIVLASSCAQGTTPHGFSSTDGQVRPPRADGSPQSLPDGGLPEAGTQPDANSPPDGSPPPDAAPPDGPPPLGPCGLAPVIPITLPYETVMTTTGGPDLFHVVGSAGDISTDCLDGDGQGAPERVFQFTLPVARNLTITTGNPGTNFPVVLYIRGADCRSYEGCDNQLNVNNPPALLIGSPAPAGTYFLIVDGFNASGTFHLTIR